MNQTIEDLKSRRSIRKFKDEQISDELRKEFEYEDYERTEINYS